jgi:thymidylate synthase (FAD)
MSDVSVVWSTQNGDDHLAYMARVSNPLAQPGDPAHKLIRYLIANKHWSPFEMVNMCVKIETERDVGRQIIRHRSFSYQEFSQRYAAVQEFAPNRIARLQDLKNRQASIIVDDENIINWWMDAQSEVKDLVNQKYDEALKRGIAKEVARAILPEGLTPTVMYMNGNVRSWMHYIDLRNDPATQREHKAVAQLCDERLKECFPQTYKAFRSDHG